MNIDDSFEDKNELILRNPISELKYRDEIIEQLKQELEEKNKQIKELEKYKKQTEKISKYGSDFSSKLRACLSLFQSIKKSMMVLIREQNENIIPDGGIYGSFVRQMFEMTFATEELFSKGGYGKCFGHDVDICMFRYNYSKSRRGILLGNIFKEVIMNMNQFIVFNQMMNHQFPRLIYGDNDYELIRINDITINKLEIDDGFGKRVLLDIPHYLLLLENNNGEQFEIDLLAWHPNNNVDFSCNTLMLTHKGIVTEYDFMNLLNNIGKKEAVCLLNLVNTQKEMKRSSLKDISYYLSNRMKILRYGYETISGYFDVIDYEIETKEACHITNIEPPYINIILVCNHKISYKCYENIINIQESKLCCPYCRGPFLIRFKKNKYSNIKEVLPDYGNLKGKKIIKKKQIMDVSQEIYEQTEEIESKEEEVDFSQLIKENNQIIIGNNNLRNIDVLLRNRIS